MNRYACHVVQAAIVWSGDEHLRSIVAALLAARGVESLFAVAANSFGGAIIEELADVSSCHAALCGPLSVMVPELSTSAAGLRVLSRFGLAPQLPGNGAA